MAARRPEAMAVLEAFRVTEMGEACLLLSPHEEAESFTMPNLQPS